MSASASAPKQFAGTRTIFEAQCRAQADLVKACDLELLDAVDLLWAAAKKAGLVRVIGADAVQGIMAAAFVDVARPGSLEDTFAVIAEAIEQANAARPKPRTIIKLVSEHGVPSAAELQAEYEASLQRWRDRYGAAPTTVEVLIYQLQIDGVAAFADANCRRRLAELSSAQLREVIARLIRIRAHYPAITDELLFQLDEQLS